ncbi:MAG: hypothetical protein KatS3mg068_0680 [Candidatus Sericytochromatia bacterium]|nr:MAG: hypothetical protein KatS3mg068_0680 [Candidatus Sericytochromatia bacterium]
MFSNYRRYILILLISVNLFYPYFPSYASKYFSDIPNGHWAENIADLLYEENIMSGVSSNEFGGNLKLTRYEAARILNGLLGKKYVPLVFTLLSDVKSGHPDFKVINKIISANLMEYSNNKFEGDKKISRYDFALSIIKTLNYLQAEPISIRIPPKKIVASSDKKDLIDKAVNYWQIAEGFYDWTENISRYEALEMVAKATKIVRQDLVDKIGEIKSNIEVIPTPTATPIVIRTPIPTPTPVIVKTPIPTPTPVIVKTPIPTPIPTLTNPYSTPIPIPTPTATPIVIRTPIPTPTPVIVKTPIPTPIPTLTNPYSTPIPIPTPTATPLVIDTPIPEKTPKIEETSLPLQTQILRNQFTFRVGYNISYSESIPSTFSLVETVKQKKRFFRIIYIRRIKLLVIRK